MRGGRVSPRVRANRQNAALSTGPRTPAGKARAARNAAAFHLRSPSVEEDPRLAPLARLIAGERADEVAINSAAHVARAHLEALLVGRLVAAVWEVYRDRHPLNRSLVEALDDPVMAEVLDPETRAEIRGDDVVDAFETRLVARIEAYARKLRTRDAADLMRRIKVLHRYQGRALARLRSACADYRMSLCEGGER